MALLLASGGLGTVIIPSVFVLEYGVLEYVLHAPGIIILLQRQLDKHWQIIQ